MDINSFLENLNQQNFETAFSKLVGNFGGKRYLLAASGGADSMVLTNLMLSAGLDFEIAHINYHLRGESSDLDEKIVADFCFKNNIPLHIYSVSEQDQKPKNSIQLWARNLRYDYFFKILKEKNLDSIVTAHHLNDQMETFFINLTRGTGIRGLSGIPANENGILRPLLNFTKDDIYNFAKKNNIAFREDLSNAKKDYLRNKIRHDIIPELTKLNKHFTENFAKTIHYLSDIQQFINYETNRILNEISEEQDGSIILNLNKFLQQREFIRYEILRKFGLKSRTEAEKLLMSESGSIFNSSKYKFIKGRNEIVILNEITKPESIEIELVINKNNIEIPENISKELAEIRNCDWKLDSTKINLPLKLKKPESGDVFQPAGMHGKKKISKFFKDEKLPILANQKIWLLCDAENAVLGVLPLRQDGRFLAKNEGEYLNLKI